MKTLKIFLIVVLFMICCSCQKRTIFKSDDDFIITTLAIENNNEFVVLTHEKALKFDLDNNLKWTIKDNFDGNKLLTDGRKIYSLFSKEGTDVSIKCIELEKGELNFSFYSDTISMYNLLLIEEDQKIFYYSNGSYFIINENCIIQELHSNLNVVSVNDLNWVTKRLRTESRLISKATLINSIELLKSIEGRDNIQYLSINDKFLVAEFESYFLYYNLKSNELLGKINTSNYSVKKLNSDLLFDFNDKYLVDLSSNQVIKYDKGVNDIFKLGESTYQVYHDKVVLE